MEYSRSRGDRDLQDLLQLLSLTAFLARNRPLAAGAKTPYMECAASRIPIVSQNKRLEQLGKDDRIAVDCPLREENSEWGRWVVRRR